MTDVLLIHAGIADSEEQAGLERGDLDAVVEESLHLWLAGPRRSLDDIDPAVRELAAEMQRRLRSGWPTCSPRRLSTRATRTSPTFIRSPTTDGRDPASEARDDR